MSVYNQKCSFDCQHLLSDFKIGRATVNVNVSFRPSKNEKLDLSDAFETNQLPAKATAVFKVV